MPNASPRLVGISYGDSRVPDAVSGVPFHLLNTLERRYPVVARVDYRLDGWEKAVLGALTFRRPLPRWRERYYVHPRGVRLRTRKVRGALDGLRGRFDLVVQVFGILDAFASPHVGYVDTTWQLIQEHWPDWLPSQAGEHAFWFGLERGMFQRATHLFTMASEPATSLVEYYGIPPERVTVVGGGCNFEPLPTAHEPGHEPTILFVGREVRRKGLDVLLAAVPRVREHIPAARLQIVGVNQIADQPGVEALGLVLDRSRMDDIYRRAGVFCLPSRYEPYGLSLVEAMAHGVPCVASDIPAFQEILGETGLLVPSGDPAALAAALVRLLEDAGEADRLGAAGRRRVEAELTWDRVVERMAPGLEAAA